MQVGENVRTRLPEDSKAVSIGLDVHGSVKTAKRGWHTAALSKTLGSLSMGWLGALELVVLIVELDKASSVSVQATVRLRARSRLISAARSSRGSSWNVEFA
jgi:hypothetical protein